MTLPDLTRLHDSTLRAMNVRNYLRREVQKLETDLAWRQSELLLAEQAYRELQARSDAATEPKLLEG
jgi:hypothetical protein